MAGPVGGVRVIAWLVAAGAAVQVVFQAAIAAGAPLGPYSWGGRHPGRLPAHLRVASLVAVPVWTVAVLIVLQRGAHLDGPLPSGVVYGGTWVLFGFLTLSVPLNAASPSRRERYLWAPFAAVLAVLLFLLARTPDPPV